jgi:signal transduction histidine kinase
VIGFSAQTERFSLFQSISRRAEARRRFGRLDSSRTKAGAALGLAEAVAHHGGERRLEDNRPGLRAVLDLPCGPGA